jgi:ribonuclease BN (tRNA processing enzyme)
MRLVLLGTTGYHPNNRRHTSCLMLPEAGILLDAGTGLFRARGFLTTRHLDVFLSHAHLDHVFGLTFLFDVLYERPMDRVTIHAEPDKLEAVQTHLVSPLLFPVPLPYEFRPIAERTALSGGGTLSHFPLDHPGGSLGFLLEWPGHRMAYVTDTISREDADYIDLIRGVDVLVHECYFPDSWAEWARTTGHSHTTPVAHIARKAGVGRLILVHMNPITDDYDPIGIDAARAIFPATQLGDDLMEIEF